MSKKTTIPRVILPQATTSQEAQANVSQAIEFASEFIRQAEEWQNGNKSAGQRARACIHNLRNNSAAVNKGMIKTDNGEWRVG